MPTQLAARIRDAFGAVITEDWDGMDVAFDAFTPDEGEIVLTLALYVSGYVVSDVVGHSAAGHGPPNRESLRRLAKDIVDGVGGAAAIGGVEEIATFLDLAAESYRGELAPNMLRGADGRLVLTLAVLCAGWLLAAYRHQGQRWEAYLYEIWAQYLQAS
jgi:hypothetical protein